jgi:hypothetical protein
MEGLPPFPKICGNLSLTSRLVVSSQNFTVVIPESLVLLEFERFLFSILWIDCRFDLVVGCSVVRLDYLCCFVLRFVAILVFYRWIFEFLDLLRRDHDIRARGNLIIQKGNIVTSRKGFLLESYS